MEKRRAYFITGTDTGVGKTSITAALARAFKEAGDNTGVMKPVETGCVLRDGSLVPQDAVRLKQAAGADDPLDLINPYRFSPPLAPYIASMMEGVEIDLELIAGRFAQLSQRHDIMFVEGAGGLLVPVTGNKTIADLALKLEIPVVIIANSRLGVINHTLLTAYCARDMGLEIKGIILNNTAPDTDDISRDLNLVEIERLTGLTVFGEIPFIAPKKEAPFTDEEGLFEAVRSNINLGYF